MRKYLFLLLAVFLAEFLFSGNVVARDVCYPVNGPDSGSTKVHYLIEKNSSVVLLCTFTPDAAEEGPVPHIRNISRKTHVSTEDGDYALVNAFHLPVRDEADARYAYIKGVQQSLNFALEFEKFPFDEPFDMVEDDTESSPFTVSGLVAGSQEIDNMDVSAFLSATPYSEYGCRFEDGNPFYYFDDGEIYLASTARPYNCLALDYLSVGFQIINRTVEPLNVKFKDLSIDVKRLNKKGIPVRCSSKICDAKDADSEWKTVDRLEVTNEANTTATDITSDIVTTAPRMVVGGLLGDALGILGAITMNAVSNAVKEPYLKERNQIREEQMKYYFKDTSIPAGDTLSTFVTIKYFDKPNTTSVSLILNGDTYKMNY